MIRLYQIFFYDTCASFACICHLNYVHFDQDSDGLVHIKAETCTHITRACGWNWGISLDSFRIYFYKLKWFFKNPL